MRRNYTLGAVKGGRRRLSRAVFVFFKEEFRSLIPIDMSLSLLSCGSGGGGISAIDSSACSSRR